MLESALSYDSIYECSPGYNILKIRRRLLQMVEAAHLMSVHIKRCTPGSVTKKLKSK